MLKKLRRCFLKKTIGNKLYRQLKKLNLIGNENSELVLKEDGLWLEFLLKKDMQTFAKVVFDDITEDMLLFVIVDGINVKEKITFSVSRWLTLKPITYKIHQKPLRENRNDTQEIHFNSGKIILTEEIQEEKGENAKPELAEKVSSDLLKLDIKNLTIHKSYDYEKGRKTYYIFKELESPILKPESTISFEKFPKLINIF